MNSKIVFFTLLSALLAQDAGKISEESLKCLKEKNCGLDLNCIPACFKETDITPEIAQKSVDCMTKNCLKEIADQNKYAICAGSCYTQITKDDSKDKKEDDKEKKEDDKDKKEDDKDKKEDDKEKKEEDKDKKEEDNKDKKEENKEDKKEGDKDKKDDSKEKKEEPKMPENANKGNSASALTGSAAFALVLTAITMAL